MPTVNDVEDPVEVEEAVLLGKQLRKAGKSKDALVKLLKKAGKFLEPLEQSKRSQEQAAGIVSAIEQDHILKHKDKDVQILAAQCFCQLLRVYAPDTPPYSTSVLAEMFAWFLVVFRRLDTVRDPNFGICHSVLVLASKTMCCLLLLDWEAEQRDPLIYDIFQVLLDSISADNLAALEEPVVELLTPLLLESEDIEFPQRLLDLILRGLVQQENPALTQLTRALLDKAQQRMRPVLQRFLMNVIEGKAPNSDLKDQYHSLIYQTLLPVLPKLAVELQVDDESKRRAALELLGKLLSQPGSDLDRAYPDLLSDFLGRTVDQKAELRQTVIRFCPSIIKACSSAESRTQVLDAVSNRLQDYDEKVRSAAVTAICASATQMPEIVTLAALGKTALRLRDTKQAVRRVAATQLMNVFRAYCSRAEQRAVLTAAEEVAIWVPGRLCLAAVRDQQLTQFLLDSVFKNGLLPASLSPAAAAKRWAALYMECKPQERQAFVRLLRIQGAVRTHLRTFIDNRAALEPEVSGAATAESTPPPPDGNAARLKQAIGYLARAYADPKKAEDLLHKLREQKDNNIFKRLTALMEPGLSVEAAEKLTKEVVQRVGSRGPLGDLCRSLCARIAPGLLPYHHLSEVCKLLIENGPDDDCGQALMLLLADAAAGNPHLFLTMADQVAELVDQQDADLARTAAQILAKAGHSMLAEGKDTLAGLVPAIKQLCWHGAPKAAKAAVRAIASMLEASAARAELTRLAAQLTAALEGSDCHTIAKLESLSGIGRVCPELFAEHAITVVDFVTKRLLPADLETLYGKSSAPPARGQRWGHCTEGTTVKSAAMKVLARAFVPDQAAVRLPAESLAALGTLFEDLSEQLEPDAGGEEAEDSLFVNDRGFGRLSAAAAILRLARAHDARMPPSIFQKLALVIQDTLTPVRVAFAAKLRKLVAMFHLQPGGGLRASKFAAILALSGMDPVEGNRLSAFGALREFVAGRRHAAERAALAAFGRAGASAATVHAQPEYMLPFLVSILAHHPDLPSVEELQADPEQLQPFSRMLQFALEALLLSSKPSPDATAASFSLIVKLLRTVKIMDDATPEPVTPLVHLMCDLGLGVARALFNERFGGDRAEAPKFREGVPLPQQFFRPLPEKPTGKLLDGAFLPQGYRVALGLPFAPAKPVLQESRTQHTKSARSGPSTANQRKVPGTTATTAKVGRTPLSRRKREAEHTGSQVSLQRDASDPDYESPSKRIKMSNKETAAEAARDSIAKRTRRSGEQATASPLRRPSPDENARPPENQPSLEQQLSAAKPKAGKRRVAAEPGQQWQSLMAYSDQEASEPNTVKPPGPSDRAASDRAHGNAATEHSPAGRAKLQPTPEKRPENQKSQPSPKKMAMLLPALQDQGRGADRERSAVALDLVAPSEDSNEGEGPSATAPPRAAGSPSTSGRDQRDATPAAAKPSPRPRAKRSRELQGLLDFAGHQGIDVDPTSPRGRRASREPSTKPFEEPVLGGEAGGSGRKTSSQHPKRLRQGAPSRGAHGAAESDLRAATDDEGAEGPEADSSPEVQPPPPRRGTGRGRARQDRPAATKAQTRSKATRGRKKKGA